VLLAREPPPSRDDARQVERIDYVWPLTGKQRTAVRYDLALPGDPPGHSPGAT
jgi:hypothetical protein